MENLCEHIYRNIGAPICPLCDRDTHEIDWQLIHDQHRQWIKDGKAVAQGWWSI